MMHQQVHNVLNALIPSSVSQLPPEILYQIYLRSLPPSFLLGPSPYTGLLAWRKTLAQKKSIVLVCRAWYSAGISLLYEDICIRRLYQLPCLLSTLQGGASRNKKFGALIKTLNVQCVIPG
ncbi:hypothetical protein B0H34DRAFT_329570 [Crassisporium funariophilum]|nr:hypothetical protein B0H34DRAFT_329570 [Crassisporium funariophilum]